MLHIITGLSMGGAERALYKLLSGGLAQGADCAVISLSNGGVYADKIMELGVPVYQLGIKGGVPSPYSVIKLLSVTKKFQPDLIQGWMYHGNMAASVSSLGVKREVPVCWNIRQCIYDIKDEKVLTRFVIYANSWFSSKPSSILFNSYLSKKQHKRLGFKSDQCSVIPNGFDLEVLRPDKSCSESMRAEFGIGVDEFVVGHVGRFHPVKGHKSFITAAVSLSKKVEKLKFLMVGTGVSYSNMEFAKLIPSELSEKFILLGERNDALSVMQAMDVFCQSSIAEAFPNVVGEAMSLGLPCVVTDVGDCKKIIGDSGIVVRRCDNDALINALLEVVGMPRGRLLEMGLNARLRIKERYELSRVISEYKDLYTRLCASP